MTKGWSAVVLDIGVSFNEDPDHIMSIIDEVGADLLKDETHGPNMLGPIEISGLDRFAESQLVFKARIRTKPATQWGMGREFRKRLKLAFDEKGIVLPYPHRTIYYKEGINTPNSTDTD